jgi:hypothetical protein
MASLIDRLTTLDACERAVDQYQPAWFAEQLVRAVMQPREPFDLGGFARLIFDLYVQRDSAAAWEFRNRLDEHLDERGLGPVRWESNIRYCWHRPGSW